LLIKPVELEAFGARIAVEVRWVHLRQRL